MFSNRGDQVTKIEESATFADSNLVRSNNRAGSEAIQTHPHACVHTQHNTTKKSKLKAPIIPAGHDWIMRHRCVN